MDTKGAGGERGWIFHILIQDGLISEIKPKLSGEIVRPIGQARLALNSF